ncbi:MAG: hypothetical protein ABIH34_00660 [Nanoarchaeota archaeon]
MRVAIDFGSSSVKAVVGGKKPGFSSFALSLPDIESFLKKLPKDPKVLVTGSHNAFLKKYLKGITLVDPIKATALGAQKLAGKKQGTIIDVGVSSIMIEAQGKRIKNHYGFNIGGGTLEGIAGSLGYTIYRFDALAKNGNPAKVNLTDKDFGGKKNTTVASFAQSTKHKPTIAAGLIHTVADSVIHFASLAKTRPLILVGRATELPSFRKAVDASAKAHGLKIIIPKHAGFATAYGALLW